MSETKQTQGREEEAAAALPHTKFSRGVAWFVAISFVATILSVPLVQKMAAPVAPRQLPAVSSSVTKTIPDAAQLKDYEKHLEDSSVVSMSIRPHAQDVLTRRFGAGNEQVHVGQDGWLFYRQAIDYLTGPGFLDRDFIRRRERITKAPNPLPALTHFAQQLKARGIKLIVLPVPVKATIYPEKLWPAYNSHDGPPQNPSFARFKQMLAARGILVCDPTGEMMRGKTLLKQQQFFKTDTHWTPVAAALTAQNLANLINLRTPLPSSKPTLKINEQADPFAPTVQQTGYTRRKSPTTADPSDLLHLLGLPANQRMFAPAPQPVVEVRAPGGKLCQPDPHADVLVLGDSYCGTYSPAGAGLSEHLSFFLKRPVDLISISNGGSWGARYALQLEMQKGHDRLKGKKLVIYEFTARDLSSGDWQILPLPDVAPITLNPLGPQPHA